MSHCDVAIVGGGAVGLLLGALLAQRHVRVEVLERRLRPDAHSRAIGVHPPGLDCLSEVEAARPLVAAGVRVRRAFAFAGRRPLGELHFDQLSGPYNFVLCVPQCTTERILEGAYEARARRAVRRGHEVLRCTSTPRAAELEVRTGDSRYALTARFVVSCEGKSSVVRASAGIDYRGGAYDARFVMADVEDETRFGSDAAVFLTRDGLVESFPLPGGRRRWVVALPSGGPVRSGFRTCAACVESLVHARVGETARASTVSTESEFTAERYLAHQFYGERIALAGDAAHVLSPIGGQGMNLGWLDARALSSSLAEALTTDSSAPLAAYSRERRRAAIAATRRAALYMAVGQTRHLQSLRNGVVRALLSEPVERHSAALFAMRGLAGGTTKRAVHRVLGV